MSKDIKDYLHLYIGCEIWSDAIQEPIGKLVGIVGNMAYFKVNGIDYSQPINYYKPILRPLSDMTHEELQECGNMLYDFSDDPSLNNHEWKDFELCFPEQAHWLIKRHFDLFGLIESGLAISSVCDECNGAGEIERTLGGNGNPEYDAPTVCMNCKGTGKNADYNKTLQTA